MHRTAQLTSYKDSRESRNTSPSPVLLSMVSGAHVACPWATLQRIPEGTTKKVQLRRLVEGGTSVVCAEHPLSLSRGTANPGANREPVFQLPRKQGTLCVSGTDRPQSNETGASKSAVTTTGVTGSLQPEQPFLGRPVHAPGGRHGSGALSRDSSCLGILVTWESST